ncbi:hypothetical protein BOX15_Mlig023293g1, partial [Macrostomum lignano]
LPHRFEPVLSACHHLPVARFAQLCSTACRICLPSAANAGGSAPQLPADPAEKEATAVLAGAMAESLSRGLPMSALLAALEERGLSGEHLAAFASVAAEFADAGASRQSPGQLPHVVGVDWRLDYLLGREQQLQQQQQHLEYHLDILTDCPAKPRLRCSRHQLQDLLAQLREALAAVESVASTADSS